jgi:cell shape-determining protein MreC
MIIKNELDEIQFNFARLISDLTEATIDLDRDLENKELEEKIEKIDEIKSKIGELTEEMKELL